MFLILISYGRMIDKKPVEDFTLLKTRHFSQGQKEGKSWQGNFEAVFVNILCEVTTTKLYIKNEHECS